MELAYLPNGQACYVKEKVGDKFIVTKLFTYEDDTVGRIEVEDTNDIIVDNIYYKPPIENIATEIKKLQQTQKELNSEISKLRQEKRKLERETANITKTQIDANKFIVNRTELLKAKSLILFPKDSPMPIKKEDKILGLKVHLNINLRDGQESTWGYKIYDDYRSSGEFLCPKYGVLVDPTQEEIDEVIVKRLNEFEFRDYALARVPEKYLSEELKTRVKAYKKQQKEKKVEKLQKKIEDTQIQLFNVLKD